jgi:hypothetical protein
MQHLFAFSPAALLPRESFEKGPGGVPAISMGNIIISFTKEAKFFEEYGLDAEIIVVQG